MKGMIWKCKDCNTIRVSFARERHTLNECNCGECFMDLEEEYIRYGGNPITLKEFDDDDYPFGLELWNDCLFQGYGYWDWLEIMSPLKRELYIEAYL